MSDPWWKKRERQIARYIGAERNRCSGSSGRSVDSRSDSTHPTLYVETKCGKQTARVWREWDKVGEVSKRPGLRLSTENILVVWHCGDDEAGFRGEAWGVVSYPDCDHWAVMTLWRDTAAKAKRESKLPVLALASKGRPGWLWVTDYAGFVALAEAIRAAQKGAKHGSKSD